MAYAYCLEKGLKGLQLTARIINRLKLQVLVDSPAGQPSSPMIVPPSEEVVAAASSLLGWQVRVRPLRRNGCVCVWGGGLPVL